MVIFLYLGGIEQGVIGEVSPYFLGRGNTGWKPPVKGHRSAEWDFPPLACRNFSEGSYPLQKKDVIVR